MQTFEVGCVESVVPYSVKYSAEWWIHATSITIVR